LGLKVLDFVQVQKALSCIKSHKAKNLLYSIGTFHFGTLIQPLLLKLEKNYRIGKDIQDNNKAVTIEFSVHDPFEGDYRHNKSEAQIITMAPVIYESWKIELKNASRSLLVTLSNTTDFGLILKSEVLEHGIWRCSPPKEIRTRVPYDFGTESHGLFGTKGTLVYSITDADEDKDYPDIYFTWDVPLLANPIFHSNIFSVEPRVIGVHNEIVLHFSSDELFILEVKEGNENATKRSTDTTATVEEKTGYGFET